MGSKTSLANFKKSFSGLPSNAIRLSDLDPYLYKGDHLYLHPDTGVVTSDLKHTPEEILNYWSNKIFTSSNTEDYSAFRPFAQGRLFYVILTMLEFLQEKSNERLSFCDFATGQGVLPKLLRRERPNWEIKCTEGSGALAEQLSKDGFESYHAMLGTGALPSFQVDVSTITWTLCNCIQPLEVLKDVYKSTKEGGYIVVAESSRIMVPFRKALKDVLGGMHPADTHPYYFSANSLSALLQCAGFETVYANRYFDSDVLLLIGKKTSHIDDSKQIDMDSPELVKKFFSDYLHASAFFEDLRKENYLK